MSKYQLIQTSQIEAELYWVVPEAMRDAELEANSTGAYLVERPCDRPYRNGRYYLATVTLTDPAKMGDVMEHWAYVTPGMERREPDAAWAILNLMSVEVHVDLGAKITVIRDRDRFNEWRARVLSQEIEDMTGDKISCDKTIYKYDRCATLVSD